MKKLFLSIVMVFATVTLFAQWATSGDNIYNTNIGNVGVGNGSSFNPSYLLDVQKNMTEPQIVITNLGGNGGATFRMIDQLYSGDWKFKAITGGGFKVRDQASGIDVMTFEKAAASNCIYVKAGGNVGIGTDNPTEKFFVNGNALVNGDVKCQSIEVTLDGWPDHVFNKDYKLRPLSEVESYIHANNHLPDIPSQTEVLQNGVNLGDMNAILLQKVEELTLYIIDLQKRITELEKK